MGSPFFLVVRPAVAWIGGASTTPLKTGARAAEFAAILASPREEGVQPFTIRGRREETPFSQAGMAPLSLLLLGHGPLFPHSTWANFTPTLRPPPSRGRVPAGMSASPAGWSRRRSPASRQEGILVSLVALSPQGLALFFPLSPWGRGSG